MKIRKAVLITITACLFFSACTKLNSIKSPFSPSSATTIPSALSQNDKYRISDLYTIQVALKNYSGKSYPTSLDQLKKDSGGDFSTTDSKGNSYSYSVLNNGTDYQLQTTMDDHSMYTVTGSQFGAQFRKQTPESLARDVLRMTNIKEISTGLDGYYGDKKVYPQNLSALVATGWGVSDYPSKTQHIPQDPSTKIDYFYQITNGGQGYILSAKLENGIEYFVRK